ncbi:MAG TPA: prolipoprotein diacylglyceryl transferase [bacterium]|jgi:phosphatidylglycerol:prolipoprotein diacylglycerol transferase|nr:prolipoprotein diacylglyceryl transferase [bacterium]
MDPILVQFGPIVIRWYGVMLATTIVFGLFMAYRYGPRYDIPTAQLDRLAIPFIVSAVVGARLGYVLTHLSEFADPLEVLRVDHGGLSSHGAIFAGLIVLWIAARRLGTSLWSLADIISFTIPLGNIFVRFGNFMNGELYGDPTSLPWGIRFPGTTEPRHPLQIYEMIFGAITLLIGVRVARRRAFEGQVFWTIMVLTSIGRIFLDALRSEERIWWIIAPGQIPAVLLVIIGVWFLRTRRASTQSSPSSQSSQSTSSGDV